MEVESEGLHHRWGESDEDLPARKRVRHDLESSMKRVHISPVSSGQLRLQNDVNAFQSHSSQVSIRIDPRNPLQLFIQTPKQGTLLLVCDKRYPHRPPQLLTVSTKRPVALKVLSSWLPVNSVSDVLRELIQ
ncbi:hypothetical protein BASA81_002424 [Batrachochytrium salamandrivorans]|nr:hypothetical protein BASA81_002424 [Batrachochytrium salamandrivorans]